MGWWTDRVVPHLTDAALSAPEISTLRRSACAPLIGRVVEIGFGSGLNLPHLPPGITAVDAVEPSDVAWSRSAARRLESGIPVSRIGLDGQSIEAEDQTYDSALVTFSLCTIQDPAQALAEVRRVLRPRGGLAFLEHGLSPDETVARWQQRLNPLQGAVCGGCQLDRDIPALVSSAGFEVSSVEERQLMPGPAFSRPWSYGFLGSARRTG